MRSITLILLPVFIKLPHADTMPKLPKLPLRTSRLPVVKEYPPHAQQLLEISRLQKEATKFISSTREAAAHTLRAAKVAHQAEMQLSTAVGPAAEATAVESVADSVVATADWVSETVRRATRIDSLAYRAMYVGRPVDPDISEENKQDLVRRVLASWTGEKAKEWAVQVMEEATRVRSQSGDVEIDRAKDLLKYLTKGEDAAKGALQASELVAEGIGRLAAAVRSEPLSPESAAAAKQAAEEAADSAAAALIAEEDAEKRATNEAKAAQQAKTTEAASRFQTPKLRVHKLFARTAGSGVGVTTAALIGLFLGIGMVFATLRK